MIREYSLLIRLLIGQISELVLSYFQFFSHSYEYASTRVLDQILTYAEPPGGGSKTKNAYGRNDAFAIPPLIFVRAAHVCKNVRG